MTASSGKSVVRHCVLGAALLVLGCTHADVPGTRNANIPKPEMATERRDAVNERPDSVVYLPLGQDVLVPQVSSGDAMPKEKIGPFELRSETLAGALQLIMADYDIPLAFETEEGLSRRITVANLHGPMDKVVKSMCSLADLYCAYEDGLLVVKDTQTFTVKIPPINQDTSFMSNIAAGLQAITGLSPIVDQSTRTIVYDATQRTSEYASRYFQQMRSATALITFETYIWEVSLDSRNSTGINWSTIESFGKFTANVELPGSSGFTETTPVSIGLPQSGFEEGGSFNPTEVFEFLSTFGAVKTISQPQITVLSGSEAALRVADTENFVSEITQTIDDGQTSTSVNTSSVDSGFEMSIGSHWDNSTVYADIEINLTNLNEIEEFSFQSSTTESVGSDSQESTRIQLPRTSERQLSTQVRIRPGDSLLIAGLVEERDNFSSSGPGIDKPAIATSRDSQVDNKELVFLLRPRVVVYTSPSDKEHYEFIRGSKSGKNKGKDLGEFKYDFDPFSLSQAGAPSFETVLGDALNPDMVEQE